VFTCPHDVDECHDPVAVLAGRDQALQDQDLEVLEHVAALAAHHLQKTERHIF
jgi:hypothetical protein